MCIIKINVARQKLLLKKTSVEYAQFFVPL